MAAPAFKSVDVAEGAGASLVFNKPAGLAAGDIMYCILANEGGIVPTAPAGWVTEGTINTTGNCYSAAFSRVVANPGSESATYSFGQNFPFSGIGILLVYDNGLTDVSDKNGILTSNNVTAPSVTTLGNDRTVINVYYSFQSGASTTLTTPAGVTSRYFHADNVAQTVRAGDFLQVSAGATGSKTSVCSGSYRTHGYTFAVKSSLSAAVKKDSAGLLIK